MASVSKSSVQEKRKGEELSHVTTKKKVPAFTPLPALFSNSSGQLKKKKDASALAVLAVVDLRAIFTIRPGAFFFLIGPSFDVRLASFALEKALCS